MSAVNPVSKNSQGHTGIESIKNSAVMQTAALINRVLCAHDGRMELEDLYAQLSGVAVNDEVEKVLKDTDMFVITADENKVVLLKTKLRLCRAKDCSGCNNLHLCIRYLFGDCPYDRGGRGCRFCHELYTGHNVSVLRQHNLLELDCSELRVILLQNDNTLLPPVCFTYNKGSGEYGHCPDKEACRRLHVCQKYIRGTCDGSTGCNRCHDFYEPHPMRNLQSRGVSSQIMVSIFTAYKNILAIWDANRERSRNAPANTSEKREICLFHIKRFCKQGNRCRQVHFHLPYKWEVRAGHSWKVLPENEEIERAFCSPDKTYSDGAVPVHFDTMTQGLAEVRRLSTPSSALNPTFILTTTWQWYWEDENGNWIQYGSSQSGARHASSISSEDLERRYQEDSNSAVQFTAGQHSYELNMQDMIQSNKHIGTKRLVKRRPVFLSAEDVQKIKTSRKEYSGRLQNLRLLPHHWDKTNMPETGCKRVLLKSTTEEYKKIVELFNQTMSGFNVESIERVQNKDLWEVFQWQGDVMRKKTAGEINEKLLFHGTKSKHTDAICKQNFDWRICGAHGTSYGKGSYFARDAEYSHGYTNASGPHCMFVCRVLVGEYTKGDSSYVRPPQKDGENTIFYDSCVNDINNPTIFVIFEKHQVYPEYLIQYSNKHVTAPPIPPKSLQVPRSPFMFHSAHKLSLSQSSKFNPPRASAKPMTPDRPNLVTSRAFGSMTSLANFSTNVNTSDLFTDQTSRPRSSNLTSSSRKFGSLTSLANLSSHGAASPALSLHYRSQAHLPRQRTKQQTGSKSLKDYTTKELWLV